MICQRCKSSGWVLPPIDFAHKCNTVAMRCECRGGPRSLADQVETNKINPDSRLAQAIRNTFEGINQSDFETGLKRTRCKCEIDEVPF